MNHTIPFDTLRFANSLKEVGVPAKQAERQAELIAETINSDLATKKDIKNVQRETRIFGSIIIVCITVLGFLIKH